jgi:Group II intron, maturase-specific domain/Reverse transcriptase (RNA-dependent DNA polymerase)
LRESYARFETGANVIIFRFVGGMGFYGLGLIRRLGSGKGGLGSIRTRSHACERCTVCRAGRPLPSNLVLDELDRELEARGHRFVRYADDSNIYVRSERAGQRVMESVKRFITEKLKLKVNESKSAVAKPQERKFLGFSFTGGKELKRKIAPKAIDRFKERIREITHKSRGRSMEQVMEELAPYVRGWRGYFGFYETPSGLKQLDSWIRRRVYVAPSGDSGKQAASGMRN